MKYPELTEIYTSREMIDVFGGYNHNLRIGSGEFYDMKNMTSDDYPVLSPRKQRGVYSSLANPVGLIAKDAVCHVNGTNFYINGEAVDGLTLSATTIDKPKTLVSMGAYVIILPDRMYVNTEKPTDHGKIDATKTTQKIFCSLCKIDGSEYPDATNSDTAPAEPKNLDLWMDTSGATPVLRQYAATSGEWVSVATTYIRVYAAGSGIGELFSVGDGITIKAVTAEDQVKLKGIEEHSVVWGTPDKDSIVITGIISTAYIADIEVTFARKMPDMDFVIEAGNRLWGCHYGLSHDGVAVNEIYASKLGDFKNWNCFAGISTDSYAASVGTDGQFTGAITHLGYPIFFKENCIHKVYGNFPANFQIQTTTCRGVQKGCERSLAIVNETLFYKSRTSVCAYDGSLPTEVSSALGDVQYSNAVAGVLGNKYYISMKEAGGDYSLFVFDTKKGMWHREDDTQAVAFCTNKGDLFYIDNVTDGADNIKTVLGTGTLDTSLVEWEAITGIIGTDSPDKKYISRMDVRLSLNVGTRVSIFADYDSLGSWEHLFSMTGTTLRSFAIPIRPKRCDHLRLKIMGVGEAKIFSITKTVEQGSDV